ncbi:MAG: transketolase [Alphaproteobacteria bacterium]|nr:MAG: transketolase [Alphaproteobacteria bacterium]
MYDLVMDYNTLKQAANVMRCIALDIIDFAGSGHQGIVLGMADVMSILWAKHINFQKQHPLRDRFILSAGHGSALLYAALHCMNLIKQEELYSFRKSFSNLPGHPEKNEIIEMSTGPLGQGLAWAVGIAKAEQEKNVGYYTYVIASDGDLMEGICHEACSLAGTWKLRKLIVFWDDNEITIDGSTTLARNDQVTQCFSSYNWNIIEIDGHNLEEIDKAIIQAKHSDKPTLVRCKTIIGYGSNYEKNEKIHGKVLNKQEVIDLQNKFIPDYKPFTIPQVTKELWDSVIKKNKEYFLTNRDLSKTNDKVTYHIPNDVKKRLLEDMATREFSGIILQYLSEKYDNIFIGSADLGKSTNTMVNTNYIHYGIREHAMTAIAGGITLAGYKSICATFLVFTDYAKPAIRLAALMKTPLIFIATHDSIGVGEDGPTHQPIEQLDGLRLIPNLNVFRPSNGLEVAWSLEKALNSEFPSIIALSRQKIISSKILQHYIKNDSIQDINNYYSRIDSAYTIYDSHNKNETTYLITIAATGSEVPIAFDIANIIEQNHHEVRVRVISVVCTNMLDANGLLQKTLFESDLLVCIEASNSNIWYKYGRFAKQLLVIGIKQFGISGNADDVMTHFGFNPTEIYKQIKQTLPDTLQENW